MGPFDSGNLSLNPVGFGIPTGNTPSTSFGSTPFGGNTFGANSALTNTNTFAGLGANLNTSLFTPNSTDPSWLSSFKQTYNKEVTQEYQSYFQQRLMQQALGQFGIQDPYGGLSYGILNGDANSQQQATLAMLQNKGQQMGLSQEQLTQLAQNFGNLSNSGTTGLPGSNLNVGTGLGTNMGTSTGVGFGNSVGAASLFSSPLQSTLSMLDQGWKNIAAMNAAKPFESENPENIQAKAEKILKEVKAGTGSDTDVGALNGSQGAAVVKILLAEVDKLSTDAKKRLAKRLGQAGPLGESGSNGLAEYLKEHKDSEFTKMVIAETKERWGISSWTQPGGREESTFPLADRKESEYIRENYVDIA